MKLKTINIWWHLRTLSLLGSGGSANHVQPAKYVAQVGVEGANKTPVGSGPYKFKSAQVNDNLVLEAVDKHWYFGIPKTKTLTYRVVPEEAARIALVRTGATDITPITRANAKPAKDAGLRTFARNCCLYGLFRFEGQYIEKFANGTPNPIANKLVRQALGYHAIDRQVIVDKFLSGSAVPTGADYPSSPNDRGYDPLPVPKFDPAKAKALLTEAGYPNGFNLDVYIYATTVPEAPEIMEAIVVWWEQIGIKVNRIVLTQVEFRAKLLARNQTTFDAFGKPTVSGLWGLEGQTVAGASAAAFHTSAREFNLSYDPLLDNLGKKWAAAANLDEYQKARIAYMKASEEYAGPTPGGTSAFLTGVLFAASNKVPLTWDIGKAQYSFNFHKVAAVRGL